MKKSLIALAVLAASGAAMAQSSVTLYGIVDANVGQSKTVAIDGGVAKKTSGVQDGSANGLGQSRWGVRGSEDLGNGLKANFNLEQSLNVSNGTGTSGFDRRAVVGLSGGFGAIDLGNEYRPIYSLAGAVAVDGLSTPHRTQDLAPLIARRANSITYTSPSFGGVQVKAQVGVNETEQTTAPVWSKDRGLGLTVAYANGPLVVGAGFDRTETNNVKGLEAFAVGGSYDLGVAKVVADFVNVKAKGGLGANTLFAGQPALVAAENAKVTELNVGVRVPMGAITAVAGIGTNKVEADGYEDGSGTDFLLGADYSLSKRTTTYARVSQKATFEDAKVKGLAVGVKHVF